MGHDIRWPQLRSDGTFLCSNLQSKEEINKNKNKKKVERGLACIDGTQVLWGKQRLGRRGGSGRPIQRKESKAKSRVIH